MNRLSLLLIFTLLCVGSLSMRIKISLNNPENKLFTNSEIDSIKNIKLMIDGNGQYIYPQAVSHNFIEIPAFNGGVHIIEAISNEYLFPVLVVDQRVHGAPKIKWLHPLDRKLIKVVQEPIIIPLERIKYFEPESGFNILSFMAGGNGLFILMGVMMLCCYKSLGKLGQAQMAPPASNQRPN